MLWLLVFSSAEGFVRGAEPRDNVIETEAAAIHYAPARNTSGIVLLDHNSSIPFNS
jgi:hypothetical protein